MKKAKLAAAAGLGCAVLLGVYLLWQAFIGITHLPNPFLVRYEPYKAPVSDVLPELAWQPTWEEIVVYTPTQRQIEALEDDLGGDIPDRITGIFEINCGPTGKATVITHLVKDEDEGPSHTEADVFPEQPKFFQKGRERWFVLKLGAFDWSASWAGEYQHELFKTGRVSYFGSVGFQSTIVSTPLIGGGRRIDTPYVFVSTRVPLFRTND